MRENLEILKNIVLYKYEKDSVHTEPHHRFIIDELQKKEYVVKISPIIFERIILSKCPICKNYFIEKNYCQEIGDKLKSIKKYNSYKIDKKYIGPYLTEEKKETMLKDINKKDYKKQIVNTSKINRMVVNSDQKIYLLRFEDKIDFKLIPANLIVRIRGISGIEYLKIPGYYCKEYNLCLCEKKVYLNITKRKKVLCKIADVSTLDVNTIKNKKVEIKNKNNKEDKKNVDKEILDKAQFVVKYSDVRCRANSHKIADVLAIISVINPKGKILETGMHAHYCYNCKKFYIHDNEYERIKKIGNPLCPIYEDIKKKGETSGKFDLKIESLLHSFGYNVNSQEGLSDAQRHKLLEYLVENGLMIKNDIISHLKFLITSRQGRLNFENAIYKWKMDIKYLNTISGFKNITRKKVDSIKITRYM